MLDVSVLPSVNAGLNGLSALLLSAGYLAIRRRRIEVHRALMIGASMASALFLVSYVTYDILQLHTAFAGPAWAVPLYYTLLASPVVLAVVLVPLAAVTLVRALRSRFDRHRRIARWTLPVWLSCRSPAWGSIWCFT